jgi:two-component system chemotaxis response regulator CheY
MGRRILTVDDSATFRKVLTHSLRKAGYEVVAAADAEEALELLDDCVVDMVITDLTMPGLNGIELTRAIRARVDLASLPVVVLSTAGEEENLRAGREAGASAWIVKPFEPEKLIAVIDQLIS